MLTPIFDIISASICPERRAVERATFSETRTPFFRRPPQRPSRGRSVTTALCFSLLTLILRGQALGQLNGDEVEAIASIDSHVFQSHLKFLADDLLEGRGTGTRADAVCQKYLAAQLELLGLEPGGESGTYFQRVPIVGMTADPSMVLVAHRGEKEERFKFRDEYVGFSGVEREDVSIENRELVFVGFGIVAPEQKWDDYKGTDVRGKILLMMNDEPASTDPKFFGGKARTYYGRWTYKYEIAAAKGAAGAIIIHTDASAGYPFQVVQTSWTGENFSLDGSSAKPIDLEAWLSESASVRLVALAGKNLPALMRAAESRKFHPVSLGIRVSTHIHNTIRRLTTANVGGLLPGSDTAFAKEVVIYTAHFDHLGIVQPVNGDSIDNGAVDNASGVSMVLTLADAFVHLRERPKRSVLFLLVGGEEAGTLGSEYYAAHPTFSPARIAADINIDGVNVYGVTNDISMIGKGRSTIDEEVDSAAVVARFVVTPDQFPEQGSFYRSDQFSFAEIGVPSAYFDTGIDFVGRPAGWGEAMENDYNDKDYHQPSDEIRKEWTYEGTMQQAKFFFHLGYLTACAPHMPRWNKGDEFESVRLKSLAGKP